MYFLQDHVKFMQFNVKFMRFNVSKIISKTENVQILFVCNQQYVYQHLLKILMTIILDEKRK